MKSSDSWVPAYMDIEWADRFASRKRRLGDTATFDTLLEEGLALWKTMGQMQPEDVAEFEYRWIPSHRTKTFQPVAGSSTTLWGSTQSLMAELDTSAA